MRFRMVLTGPIMPTVKPRPVNQTAIESSEYISQPVLAVIRSGGGLCTDLLDHQINACRAWSYLMGEFLHHQPNRNFA
jgi:hypothetical protein